MHFLKQGDGSTISSKVLKGNSRKHCRGNHLDDLKASFPIAKFPLFNGNYLCKVKDVFSGDLKIKENEMVHQVWELLKHVTDVMFLMAEPRCSHTLHRKSHDPTTNTRATNAESTITAASWISTHRRYKRPMGGSKLRIALRPNCRLQSFQGWSLAPDQHPSPNLWHQLSVKPHRKAPCSFSFATTPALRPPPPPAMKLNWVPTPCTRMMQTRTGAKSWHSYWSTRPESTSNEP